MIPRPMMRPAISALALVLAACASSSQQQAPDAPAPAAAATPAADQARPARAGVTQAGVTQAAVSDTNNFPTSPPPPAPLEPAEFPPFQEATLSNGVRLVLVESEEHPVVSMSMAFEAGNSYAPEGREGLPSMLAALLTKGAGSRSAEEIAEAIEGTGGSIGAGAGADFLTVNVGGLSTSAPLAFELLGDVVARATLPESEVELQRQQTLSGLRLAQGQPSSLAQRAFTSTLYGSHPYARQSTPESVESMTRADLVSFRDRYLKPQGALLVIAGDLSLAEAQRLAEEAFAGWTGSPPQTAARPDPPTHSEPTFVLVHRPGSVQSTIMVGNTTFEPGDPRYHASVVANRIFGGGSQGRLFQILREQRGWTYGAYSSLVRRAGTGYLAAQSDVRTEVTDSALTEIMKQATRLHEEPMPAEELELARSTIVGQFPLTVETAEQVASAVLDARLYGLPDDYLRTYRTRIAEVQPQQLAAAAAHITRSEGSVIVVVGDGTRIYESLAEIAPGPITILSTEGDTLQPSDVAPDAEAAAADAPAFDTSRLTASRDSFSVVVQGNPFGTMLRELRREGDGWIITDSSSMAGATQSTQVSLGPDLQLRSVSQQGSMQGREMNIDVTVTDGRATGTANTPASQFEEREVNATLPPGAIDDNTIATLVAALPLAPDATFRIPVFSSATGDIVVHTIRVAGTEEITVPAGTFQAYRLELTGGQAPATLWVTTRAPYRTVKLAPVGAPLEIVLVK